jgi:ABC-type amino acid transport substrate-binding protein
MCFILGGKEKMLWKRLLPILMLALLLTIVACADAGGETVEVTRLVEVTRIVETGGGEAAPAPAQVGAGEIIQRVRDRGRVVCGARTDLAGFGYLDEQGNTIGFDVDLCRAVASAMFNDPDAVEIVNLTAADRGPALQTGEVDLLSRNVTWTSSRDAQWGNFTLVTFYDGQGFIVPADSDIFEIEDLDGATSVSPAVRPPSSTSPMPSASVASNTLTSPSKTRQPFTAPTRAAVAMPPRAICRSWLPLRVAWKIQTHTASSISPSPRSL